MTSPSKELSGITRKQSEILQTALEALGPNGENWTQGCSYRDARGHVINSNWDEVNPPGAVRFCASAAIICAESEGHKDYRKSCAWNVLDKAVGGIVTWNDDKTRSWPEVKAAFEKAIANCQKAEQAQ